MILFLEDWQKYPSADMDLTTKNESFKRLAGLYRKMGVKNHAFPLALINQNLKGIDPFDPALSAQEILQITVECAMNPWFFFREIARVPGQAGAPPCPLNANRANMAMWWSFFNHVLFLLIQPRQTGKSLSVDELMVLLLNILGRGMQINLLTKDDILRRKNILRIKDIQSELPYYFQQKRFDDASNGEEITVNALKNIYTSHVPQAAVKDALNKGRGLTTPVVHVDEPPFQKNIGIMVPAMLAGMGAARSRAASVGAPYGVIMTTTAGQKDSPSGKWVFTEIVQKSAEWSERFLDARDHADLERMVTTNSPDRSFQILGAFDHRQLGYTDEWLAKEMKTALQSGEDAERDYLNIWTSGSASSPFDKETARAINDGKQAVEFDEISTDRYILSWHIPDHQIESRMAMGHYTLTVDMSEAISAEHDDISVLIQDAYTAETIAAATINETNLISFSHWLCGLMVRFKNTTLVPEMRSSARTMVDHLFILLPQHGEDPFRRIFNWIVNDQNEDEASAERYRMIRVPMARRDTHFYTQFKRYFGFATSGNGRTSRGLLYGKVLQRAARTAGDRARNPKLVGQILGLVNRNGRIDHAEGEHDDMVIAWLLGHWFLTEAKHLDFYGLDTRNVLVEVSLRKKETHAEIERRLEQDGIRREIEKLYDELSAEEDEHVAHHLEMKLRALDRRIVVEEGEIYSLAELLRTAKEAKRGKIRRLDLATTDYTPQYRHQPGAGTYGRMAEHPEYRGLVDNAWG